MRNKMQECKGIVNIGVMMGWILIFFAITIPWRVAFAGTTERVSVDSSGVQGNDFSGGFCGGYAQQPLSADGRYVAFRSYANNLVAGDTNGVADVFVRDRQTGITERVSVDSNGAQGNGEAGCGISISADGRYVAFASFASNLVTGDTNGSYDVFVRDRQTGVTERVSVDINGFQGSYDSHLPELSSDGRFVGFASYANNLVTGDTNGVGDVFVHDRQTGTTERVSVDSNGLQGSNGSFYQPALSADGRYVAFHSKASNLVLGDTNGSVDVFSHDRQTGITERVSVDSNGFQGNPGVDLSGQTALSADGRYVAFDSNSDNLVAGDSNGATDVFLRDRQTGVTERVSVGSSGVQGNGNSYHPSISGDGRYVAFDSYAMNLVAGGFITGAVFVHDRQTSITELMSVDNNGFMVSQNGSGTTLSAGGQYVGFYSYASNLVVDDTNNRPDVFVRYWNASNDLPLVFDDTATIYEDSTGNMIDVLTNSNTWPLHPDQDIDDDLLTVTAVSTPSNGSATVGVGGANVYYTPATNFFGTDTFTYTVSDGKGGTDTGMVTVDVINVNDPPVAEAQNVTTQRNRQVTITLTGSDIDGDTLSFTIVTNPQNGTLGQITQVTATSATVTYKPNRNYRGSDSFMFTVSDPSLSISVPAMVNITVY